MAMILRHTAEVYQTFKEVNGNLKIDPYSTIGRLKLSDKIMRFLAIYIDFVINSGVVSEVSKIYFKSVENEPADAIRAYNSLNDGLKQIDMKKANNHFYYDTKRLLEYFPDDMIMRLKSRKGNIEEYEALLQHAINQKMGKTKLGKISILKIPVIVEKERPAENDLDNFFMMFAPYTKEVVSQVESQLPRSVIGYLNYLSSKANLDEEEQAIMDRIERLNQPVSTEFSDDDYVIE